MLIELFQLLVHTNSFHHTEKMMQISSCQGSGAKASSPCTVVEDKQCYLVKILYNKCSMYIIC